MNIKKRNSNFELLRIISMCGIIAIHYFSKDLGVMLKVAQFPDLAWVVSHIVYSIGCPLVNCFILITGYFMVYKTQLNLRKVVDLLIITAFYGIVGLFIGLGIGRVSFSIKNLLFAIFPFFHGLRWFVETYIILILIAPFINKCINNIDKKSFDILLLIQIGIFSLWYSFGLSSPVLDDGYGIINFITLYLIGAYISLFKDQIRLLKNSTITIFVYIVLCFVGIFILSFFINPFGYAFILVLIQSVLIFICFMRLKLGCNSYINIISSTVFDVYFIHSDIYTSKFLIFKIFKGSSMFNSFWMIPHLFVVIVIFFILGFFAFSIRKKLFSISIDRFLDSRIKLNRKINI